MNRLLAGLAAGLAALGFAARSSPGLLPPGLAATLATVGRATTPVAAAALLLAALVGAAVAVRGRESAAGFRSPAPPADDVPELGAAVAAALERAERDGPGVDSLDRETVRAAVERAGTTVIARADDVDRETALARYRGGRWTTDPAVRAFCSGGSVPLAVRLEEALAPEPPLVRRARLTVAELAAVEARVEEADAPPGTAPGTGASGSGGGR